MSPETALQRQIERYRKMTGEQRLQIALELHQFACDVTRAGIRRQFPDASEGEIEQRLRRWVELSRDAENRMLGKDAMIAARGTEGARCS
jgi:hypothetical protein